VSAREAPSQVPERAVLVLFGVSGDLARRKLLPGLFHLAAAGLLPEDYRLIGTAPPGSGTEAAHFTDYVHEALTHFGRKGAQGAAWQRFSKRLSFVPSEVEDLGTVKAAIDDAVRETGAGSVLLYLAVPPAAFVPLVRALGKAGIGTREARLVIEKPFGRDLASAKRLNQVLHEVFSEEQIYRIDHFLGKEGVQNILALRFANGLFEAAWDRKHVAYVQIDVPETLTIEGRAGFYEANGAFRDMVVTHLFQLLGFVAMEPPRHFDAPSLHARKLEVFRSMRPLDPDRAIFGQYNGYREEKGVAVDSAVETFVALEVQIENARWRGVPFYLRTGKAMAAQTIAVTLGFREPPRDMFEAASAARGGERPNELVLNLADPGSISVPFLAKVPGPVMELAPAALSFSYAASFQTDNDLDAYERLLHDVLLGDQTLFNRADSVERLWRVAAPLLAKAPRPQAYEKGTWGPADADRLVHPYVWHVR